MTYTKAKPFLKWAGGKSQLLYQFDILYPPQLLSGNIKRYIEPFVGAGAVLFDLLSKYQFEEIIINDINEELILTYKVVKNNVEELINVLHSMENDYLELSQDERKLYYYTVRDNFNIEKKEIQYEEFNSYWINHAANFIFLNRTCFNGLYRLNKSGGFNVPIGSYKNPKICFEKELISASIALKNATILNVDFESLINYVDNNTFVYIDPPYRPLNATSSFTSYNKSDFNDSDQIRLAKWYEKINKFGAMAMLSNSNPKNTNPEDNFFHDLYGQFNITEVHAKRFINANGNNRGKITELVIRNY